MKRAGNQIGEQRARAMAAGATYKIGELSKLSGIGIEALRFYEKSGLLNRPARNSSGYRVYDAETLERLDFIKRAQVLGFSLDEIKRIIAEKSDGQSPCAEVREVVRRRLRELDERMAQMRLYRKDLAAALAEWDEVGDVPGHVCGLIETASIEHPLKAPRPVARKSRAKGRSS